MQKGTLSASLILLFVFSVGAAVGQETQFTDLPGLPPIWLNMSCQQVFSGVWEGMFYDHPHRVVITRVGDKADWQETYSRPRFGTAIGLLDESGVTKFTITYNRPGPFAHIRKFKNNTRYEKIAVCGPDQRLYIRLVEPTGTEWRDFTGRDRRTIGLERVQ
jgi:hypothetical protein